MKWSKGFEHSGRAVAILKMVVTTSPYGDQDKHVGLAPAIEQDAQTEHHFLRGYGSATPASRTHEEELPLKEKETERKSKSKERDDDLVGLDDITQEEEDDTGEES
jgi:outer membrane scaffolding protein for murein synthesis (MipA/OmpV family)